MWKLMRVARVRPSQCMVRSNSTGAWSECAHTVRMRDYENYLCLGLIKNNDLKRFGLCLRAFNCEVASIKDVTTSQVTADIRFAYWRDTLDKLYIRDYHPPAGEPIASELKLCLAKLDYKLPLPWFKKLLESRMNNQSDFPFATAKQFISYQDQSVSPIYYLLLEYANRLGCLNQIQNLDKVRAELDHIASHLGKAQGLVNMLRGLHKNGLLQRCLVPDELLAKNSCTAQDIIKFSFGAQESIWNKSGFTEEMTDERFTNIANLVHEIATLSKKNLTTACRIYNELGLTMKQTNYIFMPFYVVDAYLEELQKNNFNFMEIAVFSRQYQTLPLKLFWKSFEFTRLK